VQAQPIQAHPCFELTHHAQTDRALFSRIDSRNRPKAAPIIQLASLRLDRVQPIAARRRRPAQVGGTENLASLPLTKSIREPSPTFRPLRLSGGSAMMKLPASVRPARYPPLQCWQAPVCKMWPISPSKLTPVSAAPAPLYQAPVENIKAALSTSGTDLLTKRSLLNSPGPANVKDLELRSDPFSSETTGPTRSATHQRYRRSSPCPLRCTAAASAATG